MVLKLREPKEAYWRPESFSKLHHLKLLIIDGVHLSHDPKHLPNSLRIIDWSGYPSKSFPSKSFERLKSIRLRKSPKLVETLDFTKVPILEKLVLEDCINLPRVHPSIGVHKKLKVVSLKGCKNLKSLPSKFEMESLEILILSGCSKVKKIPEFGGSMECVRKLYLDGTAISKLPASIENLNGLASLKLKDCKNLVCLPSTIFNLKLLKDVDISGCSKFERLPDNLGNAESVEELDVSGTAIRHVPSSIGLLKNLKRLSLEGCKGLSSSNKSWYELIPFYSKPDKSRSRGIVPSIGRGGEEIRVPYGIQERILKISTELRLSVETTISLLMRASMFSIIISTIRWWQQKVTKSSVAVMSMMGLDLVEKEALMTYHTGKRIEKLPEFKDCDEEQSDWQKSSESDRELVDSVDGSFHKQEYVMFLRLSYHNSVRLVVSTSLEAQHADQSNYTRVPRRVS
uniref:Disease resistance protein RPS4B/Roq1-like leucine-rich repeats domain-containing protein n=1 Tax=Fagus sylvatica TaxID=28930 RepID=A0A2N9F3Y2_FAGSY